MTKVTKITNLWLIIVSSLFYVWMGGTDTLPAAVVRWLK